MKASNSKAEIRSQMSPESKGSTLPALKGGKILLNSRLLDNHWDTDVHTVPWIAPGKQPESKYDYNDSGLGYILRNRYDEELSKRREDIQRMGLGFRGYKELEDIRENDVIITIEYCTDCKQHLGTTRHDEQKYLNVALQLKKEILANFPVVKVYLKPNVVDPQDKSVDSIFVRRRIGAFEVQIAAGNDEGQIRRGVLHSKLTTKNWPSNAHVLNQMREYMLRTNLLIILDLQDFRLEDVPEDQLRNKKLNKLFEIPVVLKPYREKRQPLAQRGGVTQSQLGSPTAAASDLHKSQTEQFFPTASGGAHRPISAQSKTSIRPKSAYSTVSNATLKSINDKFGQGNAELTEEQQRREGIIKLKTDIDGAVEFKDIPYDVYVLEIKETNEFKALKKKINIFDKVKNEEVMEERYLLSHLNRTFLKISCFWKLQERTGAKGNGAAAESYLKNARLEVTPIVDNQLDEENKIIDTLNGVYDITLAPGLYVFQVFKKGHTASEMEYICRPGVQELRLPDVLKLEGADSGGSASAGSQRAKSRAPSSKDVQAHSAQQQQMAAGSSTAAGTTTAGSRRLESPSNAAGGQSASAQQSGQAAASGRPSSAKKESRPISAKNLTIYTYDASENRPISGVQIKINERKLKRIEEELFTDENGICKVTLQNILQGTLEISHPDYIGIQEEYAPNKMDLNKLKDLTFPLMQKPKTEDEVHIKVLTNSGKRVMTLHVITPDNQTISESQNNIEIDNHLEEGHGFLKIRNIREGHGIFRIFSKIEQPDLLNPSYVKVYVISKNQMQLVEVPKTHPNPKEKPKYWDIGFVRAPSGQFIEINGETSTQITRDWILSDYQKLLNFLKNNSKVDSKQILGFNSNKKMELQDDILVKKEVILESLETYSFIGNNSSIEHLLSSAIQLNGLYSYNKLNNKFNSVKPPFDWIDEGKASRQAEDDSEEDVQI